MKWIIFIVTLTITVILFTVVFSPRGTIKPNLAHKAKQPQQTMIISSPAFQNNSPIPSKYTCDGQDVHPPLAFSGIPDKTKSLLLIVDDPDAPGGTWHHWSVYNIDPKTTGFAESVKPISGKEGMTDFGKVGWGGPCPPSGEHHYHFKLYALDSMLEVPDNATLNEINNAMANRVIDQTELIGLYQRSR